MNEDFKYITAIAQHGSISKAARVAHISQPGLSQRLRRLEEQMGAELFSRDSLPLKPTASGEVYLKYAQRALAAEQNMRREVYSAAKQRRQQLSVGVSMSRADALLAEPLVAFYETHQGCTVCLREMSTFDQLHDLFLNDEIDFAVLTPIAPDSQFYESEVLCREQLMVVISDKLVIPALRHLDEAKAAQSAVSLFQLEGTPFILPSCGRYFDPLISSMIDATNAQLDVVIRDCSTELALRLVRDGLGAAIVPSTVVANRSDIRAFPLGDIVAGNMLRYIRRRDRQKSSEEELFIKTLKEFL